MRRSNSFSHLPVPTYKLERSKSLTRISRDNRPSIRTPISRPSGTAAITTSGSRSATLSSSSKLKRPLSILATPQSAKSPGKSGQISEQYLKIRSYLQDQLNCDERILNNLKPLTINNFVEIFRLLLQQIDLNIEINTTNYKEVVLNVLKMLGYPGTATISVMKTVNTMHSWPYVINIFAWLLDLISAKNNLIEALINEQGVAKTIFCNIVERFTFYNENNDENVDEMDRQLVMQLNDNLNINDDDLDDLNNRVKRLYDENCSLNQNLDEFVRNITWSQNQILQLNTELNGLFSGTNIQFKQQINDGDEENQNIGAIIRGVEENIKQLKIEIDQQPFCIREIKILNDKIDQLKHTESLKQEKFQQLLRIIDDCDCQMVNLRKKIESKIFELNSTLLPYKISYPKCEILLLDENSIVRKDFLNQIKECSENQEIISNELIKDIENLKSSIEDYKIKIDKLQRIKDELKQELDQLNDKEVKLLEEMKMYEQKAEEEMKILSNRKLELQQHLNDLLSDGQNVDDLNDQLEKAQKRKLQLKIALDEACVNTLKLFKENHEKTVDFAQKCVVIRNKIVTQTAIKIDQIQDKIIDELQKLEDFRDQN